ncbi:hypothetical protein GJ744_005063 [Endocarpon pusillum]|uniref:Uncharacterized protein n=1 Tax=Endocarpon pusillum TaxID=364733 RepID=A0A8H7E8Y2_9EURO|nr:hypothetical protein GJ744_005063 [Endocarpon pusillum]
MTTVHDPTIEEYTYFERTKRPRASRKLAVDAETANLANSTNSAKFTCPAPSAPPALSALSALPTNLTPPALPVPPAFPMLSAPPTLPAYPANSTPQYLRKLYTLEHYNKEMGGSDNHTKLNSYNLLGKKGRKLSHAQFQEEIAQTLLRGPGAILRRRQQPCPP